MVATSLPDPKTAWHTLDADKTLAVLQSDRHTGLTAQQVRERQQHYGPNELEEVLGRSSWDILLDQFSNIMLLLLIGVAVVSGIMDGLDWKNKLAQGDVPFKDTVAIMAIVILNGILGYMQESRAEKALAALKKLSSPRVRVLRDQRFVEIAAKDLVPGDIMQLEAGVQVSADARLLEVSNLQVREAALTGEAQAVSKEVGFQGEVDTPLGDRINLVFQGTEVVQGRAMAIVTRTAMTTELGRIATILQSVETEPTPLQKRMGQLSQALVTGAMIMVALVIVVGLLVVGFKHLKDLISVSLSMAVAVVPEGLPAVITVTLALGTQRMVRRRALIRKLPAVETLGSVTTICTDKTGTLTQNKMVVQRLHAGGQIFQVTGEGYEPQGTFYDEQTEVSPADHPALRTLLVGAAICTDAILQQNQGHWIILGDPTEGALLSLAGKAGIEKEQCAEKLARVAEFPFSSERKRMSVICQLDATAIEFLGLPPLPVTDKPFLMFTKGSPELVLERCNQIQIGDQVQTLDAQHQAQVLEQNNVMAAKGLRVLGFAYRPLETIPELKAEETTETELVWLGLVGMLDAPRPEVREAVARCLSAGIRPVMITGDHQLTAQAIAEDLGISKAGDQVLTGRELEHMSQEELAIEVEKVSVYARVAPEHKLRIVQALQGRGHVVAMTGDGVNDAPALKQADIGIAMGITGTDVSKEASDMVLMDDNFATIVAAVEEGRVVYTNIRRFIKYILGSNIGELITIGAAPLLGIAGTPLTPLQILWMNLVTDGLPALALAVEPGEPDVMKRPPNSPTESIFARGLGAYMVRIGLIFSILAIGLMVWAYEYNVHLLQTAPDRKEMWMSMVFTTLCLAQMGHAMAIRSNTLLTLEINPFVNPYLPASVALTTALQLGLIYFEPARRFFGTHFLTASELGVCLGVSALLFVWVEAEKLFIRWYRKRQRHPA